MSEPITTAKESCAVTSPSHYLDYPLPQSDSYIYIYYTVQSLSVSLSVNWHKVQVKQTQPLPAEGNDCSVFNRNF